MGKPAGGDRLLEGEELARIEYRSKKPLTGQVRIVTFPGADTCACCGTHVKTAGEIGLVHILSAHPLRGGVRAEMLAGERACRYLVMTSDANHAVSVALSAREGETPGAVGRLIEEHEALKYRAARLEDRVFAAMAATLSGEQLLFEPGLAPDALRRLCLAVAGRTGERCAVFSGEDATGYKYALWVPGGDNTLVKQMNAALRGKGGGREGLAQGSVQATRAEIETFFS